MINFEDVKTLLNRDDKQTLSLYLRVDASLEENQAQTPAWRIYAKNALGTIEKSSADTDSKQAWPQIQQQVKDYLEDYSPSGKGLILFSGQDFQEAYELPVMPMENMHHFGSIMVAPLLWLLDEHEKYLIVLADSEEAHFLSTYLGNIDREEAMASDRFTFDFREKSLVFRPTGTQPDAGDPITAGSNRDRFEDKMDDYITRFHSDVAGRIRELVQENRDMRVIIGGLEKSAHAVHDHLHESAKKAVVGVVAIPLQESDSQVQQRVLPVALDYERKQELETVESVINMARAKGRGALGWEDVERALEMQQVETLIAPWPNNHLEKLEAMTERALLLGSKVELVHGEAATVLQNAGGIAARLYYTVNS